MIDFNEVYHTIAENTWAIKFLFGMFIGYYIMSPRLRRFVNRFVVWVFHTGSPFKQHSHSVVRPTSIAPEKPTILSRAKPVDRYASSTNIEIEDSKLEEWLSNNPELRKLNKVQEL